MDTSRVLYRASKYLWFLELGSCPITKKVVPINAFIWQFLFGWFNSKEGGDDFFLNNYVFIYFLNFLVKTELESETFL